MPRSPPYYLVPFSNNLFTLRLCECNYNCTETIIFICDANKVNVVLW